MRSIDRLNYVNMLGIQRALDESEGSPIWADIRIEGPRDPKEGEGREFPGDTKAVEWKYDFIPDGPVVVVQSVTQRTTIYCADTNEVVFVESDAWSEWASIDPANPGVDTHAFTPTGSVMRLGQILDFQLSKKKLTQKQYDAVRCQACFRVESETGYHLSLGSVVSTQEWDDDAKRFAAKDPPRTGPPSAGFRGGTAGNPPGGKVTVNAGDGKVEIDTHTSGNWDEVKHGDGGYDSKESGKWFVANPWKDCANKELLDSDAHKKGAEACKAEDSAPKKADSKYVKAK